MTSLIIAYQVRWSQPDGGCGEIECSQTFADREEAFAFTYALDPQTCKAIRVYNLTEATPPTPRKPHNQPRRWVALCLTAERQPNGRQGYKVLRTGAVLDWLKAEASWHEVGTFYVTESVAKRSYKRAWKEWQGRQATANLVPPLTFAHSGKFPEVNWAEDYWATHDRNKYDYLDQEAEFERLAEENRQMQRAFER